MDAPHLAFAKLSEELLEHIVKIYFDLYKYSKPGDTPQPSHDEYSMVIRVAIGVTRYSTQNERRYRCFLPPSFNITRVSQKLRRISAPIAFRNVWVTSEGLEWALTANGGMRELPAGFLDLDDPWSYYIK
jgi:hypothetical protein